MHLRGKAAREVTWRTLRDWLRDALVHPLVHDAALELDTATP